MKRVMKAVAAIMLIFTAIYAVGCKKDFNNDEDQSYHISISVTDGGSATGGGTFKGNDTCTVSATANDGYLFCNWTENDSVVSINANYTFIVCKDRDLVANFAMQNTPIYTIGVFANPSNGGSVSGSGSYCFNQDCTVRAIANTGYTFSNWSEDGIVVSIDANYAFYVNSNRNLVANFMVQNYGISISSNSSNGSVSGGGQFNYGESCTVTATPVDGYMFTNWTENGRVVSTSARYTFIVTADRFLVANFTYNSGGDSYVDLGLPSGLLWATKNVGASSPEDYGDYFAWGETQPKSTYDWSTYQYCNGNFYTLTKYCNNSSYGYNGFTDNLTILQSGDDAATANYGGRMPTWEEWQELLNNCTSIWTTRSGVNGRLFSGPNGNTLFLPAAGARWDSDLNGVGCGGYYWSSSLHIDNPSGAWGLGFSSDHTNVFDNGGRIGGFPIRPVREN